MKFKLSKKEMDDLLKQWIIFRDEELSRLTRIENIPYILMRFQRKSQIVLLNRIEA